MSQKAKRVTVKADGETYTSKPGAAIDLGGVVREDLMSDQKTVHFTEDFKPSVLKVTLIQISELDLIAIRQIKNATILYETDIDQNFVIRGGYFKDAGELANGEVEVTFGGNPAEAA